MHAYSKAFNTKGWRRLIGCLKLQVIFHKKPSIIGLFCGKWPMKIRRPLSLRHPVWAPTYSKTFLKMCSHSVRYVIEYTPRIHLVEMSGGKIVEICTRTANTWVNYSNTFVESCIRGTNTRMHSNTVVVTCAHAIHTRKHSNTFVETYNQNKMLECISRNMHTRRKYSNTLECSCRNVCTRNKYSETLKYICRNSNSMLMLEPCTHATNMEISRGCKIYMHTHTHAQTNTCTNNCTLPKRHCEPHGVRVDEDTDVANIAATHCITLQHHAGCYNTLQHTGGAAVVILVATHCITLQHTAARCNTLQHAATHCNTLRHTGGTDVEFLVATHCNTLQHAATRWGYTRRNSCFSCTCPMPPKFLCQESVPYLFSTVNLVAIWIMNNLNICVPRHR